MGLERATLMFSPDKALCGCQALIPQATLRWLRVAHHNGFRHSGNEFGKLTVGDGGTEFGNLAVIAVCGAAARKSECEFLTQTIGGRANQFVRLTLGILF